MKYLKNDDRAMARAAARGDRQACEHLVAQHGQRLLRLVIHLLGNSGEAEEVLQDGLLKAFRNIGNYDASRGTLHTWLSTIVWRTALNHLRLHPRHRTVSIEDMGGMIAGEPAAADGTPFDDTFLDEAFSTGCPSRVDALAEALQLISDEERALLQLRYNDDLPLADMAAIVGTDPSALASRLYRIRKKLYNLILNIEENGTEK